MSDILFEPLVCRNLTIKNRIIRSNISGRFDNYDGSGTQTRINWETKFARGAHGNTSAVDVQPTGRAAPAATAQRLAVDCSVTAIRSMMPSGAARPVVPPRNMNRVNPASSSSLFVIGAVQIAWLT